MFRNKFNDVFPKNLTTFGPQELEREIVDSVPGDRVEAFLCAILKLLLNRQQEVKYAPPDPSITLCHTTTSHTGSLISQAADLLTFVSIEKQIGPLQPGA